MMKKDKKYNSGYTLLFAVLVSSLVLSVGISILNISKKEFLLASSARESIIAFYAADTGLRCAAYLDPNKFTVRSSDYINQQDSTCSGHQITTSDKGAPYDFIDGMHTYTFDVNINNQSCATIVLKSNSTETNIESRGYNLGWDSSAGSGAGRCNKASPRRVERAIHYRYTY